MKVDRATANTRVTVFGAYGHTGHFVVAELRKRGWTAVLSGRDHTRLMAAVRGHAGVEGRVARIDDPASLDAALSGSSAVINCAGPFFDTAIPLIEAAIRSGVHYLDVAAEQAAVLGVFDRFQADTRSVGIAIVPAMAFFGGLGDLMATAAMGDWDLADAIEVAVALDSWRPTRGTRLTGQRNPAERFVFSNNTLMRPNHASERRWTFPAPFGEQQVVPLTLAETVTISRHLRAPDVRVFMNAAPFVDLRNPDTPPPSPADSSGRSSQTFLVDVVVRRGREARRVVARGQDIYAATAPIVVEAAARVVTGTTRRRGVVVAGEAFDARDFLNSLSLAGIAVDFQMQPV
jgi:short subunit dehydrogenase-like uncharacterized protein